MNNNCLLSAWNKYWFEEKSRESFCLIRIFFGLVFLVKLTFFIPLLREGVVNIIIPKFTLYDTGLFHIEGFRNAVPGFEWLPVPSFTQYQNIEIIIIILAVLFTIGLFTRYVGPVLAIIYTYLFLISQHNYHHHVFLIVIVLYILGFSNCYMHYSMDSYLGLNKEKDGNIKYLPIRLLQVLISIVYLFSFLHKCNHGWLTGELTYLYYQQGTVSGYLVNLIDSIFSVGFLSDYKIHFWKLLGPLTVITEGFLAFAIWIPRLRRFAIFVGLIFHSMIFMFINVETFSFQMWVLYMAFIHTESKQNKVYYNGNNVCDLRFIRICKLLDWFKRIELINSNNKNIYAVGLDNKQMTGVVSSYLFVFSLFPITFIPAYIVNIFYSVFNRRKMVNVK